MLLTLSVLLINILVVVLRVEEVSSRELLQVGPGARRQRCLLFQPGRRGPTARGVLSPASRGTSFSAPVTATMLVVPVPVAVVPPWGGPRRTTAAETVFVPPRSTFVKTQRAAGARVVLFRRIWSTRRSRPVAPPVPVVLMVRVVVVVPILRTCEALLMPSARSCKLVLAPGRERSCRRLVHIGICRELQCWCSTCHLMGGRALSCSFPGDEFKRLLSFPSSSNCCADVHGVQCIVKGVF